MYTSKYLFHCDILFITICGLKHIGQALQYISSIVRSCFIFLGLDFRDCPLGLNNITCMTII